VLLAIDSSAGTSAAVVDRDHGVLAERSVDDPLRHAEVIGDLIAAVLAESGAAVSALAAVAVGVGPGPFTGLRVGMAAARAFAFAAGKPLLGVVSHDAIALTAYGEGRGELLVSTDARRKERYWSRYSGLDSLGLPVRSGGPALARPEDVPAAARRIDATAVPAGALGLIAERLRISGRAAEPIEPLYLRSPDVTLAAPKRVS
jgi:tRNA threonylcarbamoyl adenosine modification protein YeaZ